MQSDAFDCPVCLEEMKPPKKIFQCSNGHSFCETCKMNPALRSCPVCRVFFNGSNVTRNILAETLAGQMTSSQPTDGNNVEDLTETFTNLGTSLAQSPKTKDCHKKDAPHNAIERPRRASMTEKPNQVHGSFC